MKRRDNGPTHPPSGEREGGPFRGTTTHRYRSIFDGRPVERRGPDIGPPLGRVANATRHALHCMSTGTRESSMSQPTSYSHLMEALADRPQSLQAIAALDGIHLLGESPEDDELSMFILMVTGAVVELSLRLRRHSADEVGLCGVVVSGSDIPDEVSAALMHVMHDMQIGVLQAARVLTSGLIDEALEQLCHVFLETHIQGSAT